MFHLNAAKGRDGKNNIAASGSTITLAMGQKWPLTSLQLTPTRRHQKSAQRSS